MSFGEEANFFWRYVFSKNLFNLRCDDFGATSKKNFVVKRGDSPKMWMNFILYGLVLRMWHLEHHK